MITNIIPRKILDSVPTGEFSSHKKCVPWIPAVLSRVDGGNDADIDY